MFFSLWETVYFFLSLSKGTARQNILRTRTTDREPSQIYENTI